MIKSSRFDNLFLIEMSSVFDLNSVLISFYFVASVPI
jgi:hypothetical protein